MKEGGVISTTALRLSAPMRARIRIRRLSTIERVSWRRAGFVAEYDLLAEGWTVEAVDSLGSPGMVAGATRLYSIDLVAAHASERVALRLLGEVDD
jgi:hypothetical protein